MNLKDVVARRLKKIMLARHYFSMIEVVLGIGLITFGLVNVMRLFPVSLNATRDSIADSYAANSADQFLHFLSAKLRDPSNNHENWQRYGLALPSAKPSSTEPSQTWRPWFGEYLNADSPESWTTKFSVGGSANQYYKIEQRAAGPQDGPGRSDFSAVYRVWRNDISFPHYVDGSWQQIKANENVAMAINIEISWPLALPYRRRHKSLYHLEVYKSL